MTTSKPSYGGRRPGAGRKSKSGKTVVKRIPESLVPAVDALIEHAVILTQNPAGSLPPDTAGLGTQAGINRAGMVIGGIGESRRI